jgi:hypothetical protein
MESITIKNKIYPLLFGLFFQSEFENDTGITMEEFDGLPKHKATRAMIKLLYWSLRDGARNTKKPLDLNYDDLIDAIEADQKIIEQFSDVLQSRYEKKVLAGQPVTSDTVSAPA